MKNKLMLVNKFTAVFILGAAILTFANIRIAAQGDTQTRSITSDDFSSRRPPTKKSNAGRQSASGTKYKFITRQKPVARRKSTKPRPQTTSAGPTKTTDIGVTLWRMRAPVNTDKGAKLLPVKTPDGAVAFWTPERVTTETAFHKGERVRMAIESSSPGYLYVVDSETYSDGTFGEPYLLFPAETADDNSVQPGMLVDLPDQTEDFPYFQINPKGSKYTGELLTVIISPKRLTGIKTDKDGLITNLDDLIDLENSADVEIFSRTDLADKTYTQAEADAACGSKSRQLIKEKTAEKPCGSGSRQLTRDEPMPQSIYRIKTAQDQPSVAFIYLKATP